MARTNKTHVRSRWPNTGGGRILRPCAVGLYKAGCTPHETRPRNSWLGLSAMLTLSIQTNQLELPGAHDSARPRGDEKKVNSDRHPHHAPRVGDPGTVKRTSTSSATSALIELTSREGGNDMLRTKQNGLIRAFGTGRADIDRSP